MFDTNAVLILTALYIKAKRFLLYFFNSSELEEIKTNAVIQL